MSSFPETVGSWRVAVRVARRAAFRSPARNLLIVLMLALPVYAGTALALSYAATYTSGETEASWRLGRTDWELSGGGLQSVLETLPPGSETTWITYGNTVVRTGDTYRLREYASANVDDPLTEGIFAVRSGRAPRGSGEAAVSARLASQDGVKVGDRVLVGIPPRERTVVGIVDASRELSIPLVVTAADQALSDSGRHALIRVPKGVSWNPHSAPGASLSTMYRPDLRPSAAEQATRTAAFVLVVGFAGTQVALLAGAAFAVGARRQRRELAMVGAVGASRNQVARMVLANGLVLGALAGIAGVALGALTYWLNRDRVERIANHPLNDGAVPVLWLTGIALFAVAVGLVAALGPARAAARQSMRSAMADREPSSKASNVRWLVGGLLLAAGGAAAAMAASRPTGRIVTVTAGTVAVLLGVTAFAPLPIAALGRLAGRLPLALRLAARHAARHRLRTAASAAAVCTAVAGSTALMLFNAAESTEGMMIQPNARTGQVLVPAAVPVTPGLSRAVEQALPARSVVSLTVAVDQGAAIAQPSYENAGMPMSPSHVIAVGGAEVIRAVTGAEPTEAALRTLAEGGAVAFYRELMTDGQLTIVDRGRLPAVLVPAPDYYTDLPGAVISAPTAARHGIKTAPGGAVVDVTRVPTAAELVAANSHVLAAQLAAGATGEPVEVAVGAKPLSNRRDYSAMFLVLAAVTLAASAVAVGLATSEMRNDLSTLAAVGAGPRLRRRIAAAQAGLIVGVGAVLGVVGGIAPAAGMVAFRRDLEWHVPWLPLVVTVLVAPALAVLLTAVFTRPRLILVRRFS
jgi:putative ABC transport system permease protein